MSKPDVQSRHLQQVFDWGAVIPPDIVAMVPFNPQGVAKKPQVASARTQVFLSHADVEDLVSSLWVDSKVNCLSNNF